MRKEGREGKIKKNKNKERLEWVGGMREYEQERYDTKRGNKKKLTIWNEMHRKNCERNIVRYKWKGKGVRKKAEEEEKKR